MSPSHPAGGAGVGAAAEARGVPPVLDAVRRGGGVQAHDQQEWVLHQNKKIRGAPAPHPENANMHIANPPLTRALTPPPAF